MKSNPKSDVIWMQRALRLAAGGLGKSSPNPSVGACIVKNNKVLGEGVHVESGKAHGEILALANAKEKGNDVQGATMYITLSPCTKHGKTPPCANALIEAGIGRIVVALPDQFQDDPRQQFADQNITYEDGCLEHIAAHIHGGFVKRMRDELPRITGKWAMTLDGYIACENGRAQWISNDLALGLSRRRRRVFDAIIVGSGTFKADNPSLLAQADRSPKRVIVARNTIPDFKNAALLKNSDIEIICYHDDADLQRQQAAEQLNIKLIKYDSTLGLKSVFESLATDEQCNDVLVEGGAQIHEACLKERLYDRIEIYMGAKSLGGGLAVAGLNGVQSIDQGGQWKLEQEPLVLGDCICLRYQSIA